MNSIYDMVPDIALENIKFQTDTSIVDALEIEFQTVIDNTYSSNKTIKDFRSKPVKKAFENIDKLIEKRFGIKVKHTHSTSTLYGTIFAAPINLNSLYGDLDKTVNALEELDKNDNTRTPVTEIDNGDLERRMLLKHLKDSYKSLDKQLKKSKIIVNRKDATIKHLPSDFINFLLIDIGTLKDAEIPAKQWVALLLHEVGHMFTAIEYSVRTVKSTSGVIDSIRDLTDKKGKSLKDSISITYKDVTEDTDTGSADTMYLNITNKLAKDSMMLNPDDRYSSIDAEMLADQFASRFGLEVEIAKALLLYNKYGKEKTSTALKTWMIADFTIWSTLTALVVGSLGVGLLVGIFRLIQINAATGLVTMFNKLFTNNDDSTRVTYDNLHHRVRRLRIELIKTLRSTDLKDKELTDTLNKLDFLKKITDNTKEYSGGIVDKFIETIFSDKDRASKMKELDVLTENMLSNELYVMANKLKNI